MSYHSSIQIKTLSGGIADIYIDDAAESGPRPIGVVLRPLMTELRRSRTTGEPMRKEILEHFCGPALSGTAE